MLPLTCHIIAHCGIYLMCSMGRSSLDCMSWMLLGTLDDEYRSVLPTPHRYLVTMEVSAMRSQRGASYGSISRDKKIARSVRDLVQQRKIQ